jgi:hypothetical protein
MRKYLTRLTEFILLNESPLSPNRKRRAGKGNLVDIVLLRLCFTGQMISVVSVDKLCCSVGHGSGTN